MVHKSLFVFDIETIPDTDAVRNLTSIETKDIGKLRQELEEYHMKVANNPFPRQPFHKIVAISFLEAEIEMNNDGTEEYNLTEIRSGGNEDSNEEEIVKGFFQYLARKKPRFVSYNGRTFDFPVLKYRAMKYGISAPWFYRSGDKWNNYSQRYSLDWHCDLLEAFSDFGASSRCKMNEICSILDLPGKFGVDGSKVTDMFDEKRIKEIRDYCETDVANTYLLYLFYQMHTGAMTQEGFVNAAEQVASYLESEGKNPDKKHFADFLVEWKKVDNRFF